MDLKQFAALAAMMPDTTLSVEVIPANPEEGKAAVFVDLHPVGVRPFVKYVVRRFNSVREQFVGPVRAGQAMATKLGPNGEETEGAAEAFVAAYGLDRQVSLAVDDKDEADSAFVALSVVPNPKSLAELQQAETLIARFSTDVFDRLLDGARQVTWGDDPAPFIQAVTLRVTGVDLRQSQPQSA